MNPRLEILHARYAASLPAKQAKLMRVWIALQADHDNTEHWIELHDQLHRLSGSAGAYGYASIGDKALRLDESLRDWLQISPAQRSSARPYLESLRADMTMLCDALADPPKPENAPNGST